MLLNVIPISESERASNRIEKCRERGERIIDKESEKLHGKGE